MDSKRMVRRLSAIGILGNIVLSSFKMFAGIVGNSSAMVSDAIHSLSDVFATAIAAIGVHLSKKTEDKKHPYGYERFECVASLFLGLILAGTGIGISYDGLKTIISSASENLSTPTLLPLIAAVTSIVVKEAMYHYTMYYAKKLDSIAFKADAWHHRSDAFSSIGSLIGIAGARLGIPVMEPVASVAISACIIKVSYDILRDSLKKLVDTSSGTMTENEINAFVSSQPGVRRVDSLRTRLFGNVIYADIEISADDNLSLKEAHEIAESVHDGVEKEFSLIKHITVQVNPVH